MRHRDVEMFTSWALSGLCAHHNAVAPEGSANHVPAKDLAARALEIGVATADAVAEFEKRDKDDER